MIVVTDFHTQIKGKEGDYRIAVNPDHIRAIAAAHNDDYDVEVTHLFMDDGKTISTPIDFHNLLEMIHQSKVDVGKKQFGDPFKTALRFSQELAKKMSTGS